MPSALWGTLTAAGLDFFITGAEVSSKPENRQIKGSSVWPLSLDLRNL